MSAPSRRAGSERCTPAMRPGPRIALAPSRHFLMGKECPWSLSNNGAEQHDCENERRARDGVHPRAFGARDPAADAPGGHPAADHGAAPAGARESAAACGSSTWAAVPAMSRCSPPSWSAHPDRSSGSIAARRSSGSPGNGLGRPSSDTSTSRQVSVEAFSDPEPFDAVIGRYVLIHQADPVAFIRAAASLVRPGGVVAFHELCIRGQVVQSLPSVSLWQQAGEWIRAAFQAVAPHYDAGGRLIEHFRRAGLPQPTLFCESPVGGGEDSPSHCLDRGHSRGRSAATRRRCGS